MVDTLAVADSVVVGALAAVAGSIAPGSAGCATPSALGQPLDGQLLSGHRTLAEPDDLVPAVLSEHKTSRQLTGQRQQTDQLQSADRLLWIVPDSRQIRAPLPHQPVGQMKAQQITLPRGTMEHGTVVGIIAAPTSRVVTGGAGMVAGGSAWMPDIIPGTSTPTMRTIITHTITTQAIMPM